MDTPQIQTLTKKADKAYKSKRYSEAAKYYREAADLSAQAGNSIRQAELMNNVSVSLVQAGNAQAGLEASLGTERVFAEAGDIHSQALALGNQAAALEALNKLDEALERYIQCNDLLKQTGDEATRSFVLKSISTLQLRTGHQFEALAYMEAALDRTDKLSTQEKILKNLLKVPMNMVRRG
jgi:tetratricopeptide (TPR) repeat protein